MSFSADFEYNILVMDYNYTQKHCSASMHWMLYTKASTELCFSRTFQWTALNPILIAYVKIEKKVKDMMLVKFSSFPRLA